MLNVNPAAVAELLRQGESELVEFKRHLLSDRDIARLLVAFANGKGGIIVVGVNDDGNPVGLSDDEADTTMQRVKRVSDNLLNFPGNIIVGNVSIKGRRLVYAAVSEAPPKMKPVATSTGEFVIRRGEEIRHLDAESRHHMVVSGSEGLGPLDELVDVVGAADEPKIVQRGRQCTVFVAMSFRDEQEPALVDYYKAMEQAAERSGCPIKLCRIDQEEGDYEISQQVMDEIDRADIVLGDLTLTPHNVYFELGYARGRRKRIIQTARKGTTLEFDVRNWRTVFYVNATQLEEKLLSEFQVAYRETF